MRDKDRGPEAAGDARSEDKGATREPSRRGIRPEESAISVAEPPPWPLGLRVSGQVKMTCSVPHDLAVVLAPQAFTQLFGYAYSTGLEISCLGIVRRDGALFQIERFCLVKQHSSTGHTELDQEAVAAVVEELRKEGKADELTALKCWAHSHPNLGLFWSKTDDDTCARLVSDWLVSLVVSNDFAIRCRIDVGGTIPFTIDQVPVFVEAAAEKDLLARVRRQVQELVSEGLEVIQAATSASPAQASARVDEYCEVCGRWHGRNECPFDDWPLLGFHEVEPNGGQTDGATRCDEEPLSLYRDFYEP